MSADDVRRQAVIGGLRELADFLQQHPDMPVGHWELLYHAVGDTDAEQRAEVDRVATLLGVAASGTTHYKASRDFGGIAYEAIAIESEWMRRYDAERSYRGAIEPEEART